MKTKRSRLFFLWTCVISVVLHVYAQNDTIEPALSTSGIPIGSGYYGKFIVASIIAKTDGELTSTEQTLQLLSVTREVKAGIWEMMFNLFRQYENIGLPGTPWYARYNGNYYTVAAGLKDDTLRDTSFFPNLITGKSISGAYLTTEEGIKSTVIAVPVMKSGKISGAVGTYVNLERLSHSISITLDLPENMSFFAMAPDGKIVLHQNSDMLFKDLRKEGSATLAQAAQTMLSKEMGILNFKSLGIQKQIIFRTSPVTNWRFALEITGN